MMRFRFSSGLTLGLALGIPAGALLALLLAPARPADNTLQVQELMRRLEVAKDARERADQQLEKFQTLAEQMTASFTSLEARFKALEAEANSRAASAAAAAKAPPPTPPLAVPEAAPAPAQQ